MPPEVAARAVGLTGSLAIVTLVLVFLLLAIGLWLVPMLLAVAQSGDPVLQAYRDNILLRQTVTRYANAWHHVKPFWYYLTSVIPPFWLPVSLLLPWLVVAWRKAILGQDKRIILLLGYLVLVIVFFSVSPGKRGVYVTPGTPALALLTAPFVAELLARVRTLLRRGASTMVESQFQAARHHTLGNSRRAEQEDTLSCHCRQQGECHHMLFLENTFVKLL